MSFPSIALKAALVSLVLVAAFYLLREHWGHGLGMGPYLLLLACPLLHLFLHGHGNAGGARSSETSKQSWRSTCLKQDLSKRRRRFSFQQSRCRSPALYF